MSADRKSALQRSDQICDLIENDLEHDAVDPFRASRLLQEMVEAGNFRTAAYVAEIVVNNNGLKGDRKEIWNNAMEHFGEKMINNDHTPPNSLDREISDKLF